jgi:hypothetical protein
MKYSTKASAPFSVCLVASGGSFTGEVVALVVVLDGVVLVVDDEEVDEDEVLLAGGSPSPEHAARTTPPTVTEAARRHAAYGRLFTWTPLPHGPAATPECEGVYANRPILRLLCPQAAGHW